MNLHNEEKSEIFVHPLHTENAFDLPFWRDNKKLWALDVPSETISIDELLWIFDVPFWEDEEGNIVITPNEVLQNPNNFPDHYRRIIDADTSYPLDIMKNKKDKWLTLDGLHRLVKLYLNKQGTAKVRKIPPDIIHLTARD